MRSTSDCRRSRSGLKARIAKNRNVTENQGELAFMLKRLNSASADVIRNAKRPVMASVAAP